MLYWNERQSLPEESVWPDWAKSGHGVNRLFKSGAGLAALRRAMAASLADYSEALGLSGYEAWENDLPEQAAEFLALTLARNVVEFPCSKYARALVRKLRDAMEKNHMWADFAHSQAQLRERPAERAGLALTWLSGLAGRPENARLKPYAPEAAALLLMETEAKNAQSKPPALHAAEADLTVEVTGLLSTHPNIKNGTATIVLDDFYSRLRHHKTKVIPGFRRFQELRRQVLERERETMRLSEFKPKPLSSFVRNRLIDQVYLPMVGTTSPSRSARRETANAPTSWACS